MKHHCKYVSKRLALLLMVLFVGTFTLTGCGSGGGSDSYSTQKGLSSPVLPDQIDNVLIDAETLKGWIDGGYVNKVSQENVVILQQSKYDDGHIPGALEWSESGMDRIEGPILSGNMVFDGKKMQEEMQRCGIQTGSTIVFMGSNAERTYFMFRYWGFPKSQLKILNGGIAAWKEAGYALTTENPVVQKSSILLNDIPGTLEGNVRASLSEMIEGVSDGTVIPFATFARTLDTTKPLITGTLNGTSEYGYSSTGFVLFQGEMLGEVQDPDLVDKYFLDGSYNLAANLYKSGKYLSAEEMRVYLKGILGEDDWKAVQKGGSKAIATFCRAGNLAATGFTPMEAVLGKEINVMLYDGSWSQWGSLATSADAIPDGKLWAVSDKYWDAENLMTENIFYAKSVDAGEDVEIAWADIESGHISVSGDVLNMFDKNGDGIIHEDEKTSITIKASTISIEQPHFFSPVVDLEADDKHDREYGLIQAGTGLTEATGSAGGGC